MKIRGFVCILLSMLILTGCSSPFENKYVSATELFTDFNELKEGSFDFNSTFEIIHDDVTIITSISMEGVTDGKVAVCKYGTDFEGVGQYLGESIYEPVVYIENAEEIRSYLMYALLDACGSEWDYYDDYTYTCGTDDNFVVGEYFSYLSGAVNEAGENELSTYIRNFSQEIKQAETQSVINTKITFKSDEFSEKISGNIVMDGMSLNFSTDYSFKYEKANYSSDSEYVTLKKALEESYDDVYKVYGAQLGIYEEEIQKMTSHVANGNSLIVQGYDEVFYKFVWDGYRLNYSNGDLDYGMWTLSLAEDKNTSIRFQMFLNDAEGLIQWYHDTYGSIMTVSDETEEIEAGIGTVTHSVITYLDNGNEYINDMYLYQVSDEFLMQVIIENSTKEYTNQELLDMALVSCTLY